MRAVYSSYNNSASTTAITTNAYQQDKDQLNALMDKMKKSIESGDFESAKALLQEADKLIESNSNNKRKTRIAQQQAEFKSQLDTLSDTLNKQDKKSALETIANIKDELKNNKNLVLKSHQTSDIIAEIRSQYLLSIYA
ncbi:DUF4175 family protein [Sulfuricurvum sp.]|uniref:DUF4175 family protein n=1 Tax=Sulfuricurvum sp. TaxID=2025608 RepID=UPI0026310ADA|nr:DUF4175 family protein [Sulfuricurvum sp.]MDD2838422.1 DUF4175 family protein [Sulfuricurvum sp.]MDD3597155.1 DUF4175 family protein [Sulfuricurvum sp.]MDD4884070.1 DUF4175 family protein [Sulfuricurvum sp.]